jgi:adenosylhomocysteine nucleosidase
MIDTGEGLTCDLLLLTVTKTEQEQLLAAADELQLPFTKRRDKLDREFHDFGKLGAYRVLAIRSKMGPLGYGGSAAMAQFYRAETQATGIIAVGMAFGMSSQLQRIGDVLVSSGIFPYDDRDVVSVSGVPEYRYERPIAGADSMSLPDGPKPRECARYRPAKPSLIRLFERHVRTSKRDFHVHFGALLSGGARIQCAAYRDMLYRHFEGRGKPIVGGEMEAVGLLSCSDPQAPWWIVVKGICDFADENCVSDFDGNRQVACRNAASFVLASLRQATEADKL